MNEDGIQRKKILSPLLLMMVAVVLMVATFLAGYMSGSGKIAPTVNLGSINNLSAACDDSELLQRLLRLGYLPPEFDPSTSINSISGKITNIGNGFIEVSAQLTPIDETSTFKVQTDDNTEILIQRNKDASVMEKEFQAYNLAIGNFNPDIDTVFPEPPTQFSETVSTLEDLKIGADITIISEANLRDDQSFVATKMYSLDLQSTPAPDFDTSVDGVVPEEALPTE